MRFKYYFASLYRSDTTLTPAALVRVERCDDWPVTRTGGTAGLHAGCWKKSAAHRRRRARRGSGAAHRGAAAHYAVSRTVAREAIRVLESMGLVTSRRRVGVTVTPRAQWNVFDPMLIRWRLAGSGRADQLRSLSELRAGFEPAAARYAATRATPEQCGVLTKAVMDMAVHGRRRMQPLEAEPVPPDAVEGIGQRCSPRGRRRAEVLTAAPCTG